ncbi:peptidoglycan recognition protein family protein [Candidatus Micrarchaeota archaeon]|nr:peptidoglycan recognition protein family protein [Candidatus Micrarchaeota archaeon]
MKLSDPSQIVIHHTGNKMKTVEETYKVGISKYNQPSYHYIIDRSGEIFQTLALNIVGAHTKNHNNYSFGIALLNLTSNKPMSLAMRYSLSELIKYLQFNYRPLSVVTHFQVLLGDINSTARRCSIELPELNEEYYIKQGFKDLSIGSVEIFKRNLLEALYSKKSDDLSKQMVALAIEKLKNCPGYLSKVLL